MRSAIRIQYWKKRIERARSSQLSACIGHWYSFARPNVDWFKYKHSGKKCVRLNIMQQNGHISSANTGTHIPHLTAVYWFMNVKCVWQFSVWLVVDFPFGNCHCNCYAIQYTNYPSLSPFLSLSLSIFHLIWCNFLFSFNPIDIFVWNIQRKFIYWFWPHFVASFSLTSKWMFHQ